MTEPIDPDILEPDENLPPDLRALRKLADTLDAAFPLPGTKRRVGLAPAIGLIPGFGDAFTAIISSWIVIGAIRHRVPAPRVARMALNVIIDLWIGSIPVIGDLFDFFFQENLGNVEILMRYRDRTRPPRSYRQIGSAAALVLVAILGFSISLIIALVMFLEWAFRTWDLGIY